MDSGGTEVAGVAHHLSMPGSHGNESDKAKDVVANMSTEEMRAVLDGGAHLAKRGYTHGQTGVLFASAFLRVFLVFAVTVSIISVIKVVGDGIGRERDGVCEEDPNAKICHRQKQQRTSVKAFTSFAVILTGFIGFLLGLHQAGVNSTALFTVAGAASIVVGLAAQNLLKDIFAGVVMLAENQVNIGDWVEVAIKGEGHIVKGTVRDVTIRKISIRQVDGTLSYISNGEIASIANANREKPSVRVNFFLAPNERVELAVQAVQSMCSVMASDSVLAAYLEGAPFVLGINANDQHSYTITVQIPCMYDSQWYASRQIRYEGIRTLQRLGIKASVTHVDIDSSSSSIPRLVSSDNAKQVADSSPSPTTHQQTVGLDHFPSSPLSSPSAPPPIPPPSIHAMG